MAGEADITGFMGPPISPEVIGRLQGIEANPYFDPLGIPSAAALGFKPMASLGAQLVAELAKNFTGSEQVGNISGAVAQGGIPPGLASRASTSIGRLGEAVTTTLGGRGSSLATKTGGRVAANVGEAANRAAAKKSGGATLDEGTEFFKQTYKRLKGMTDDQLAAHTNRLREVVSRLSGAADSPSNARNRVFAQKEIQILGDILAERGQVIFPKRVLSGPKGWGRVD